jgi:Tfp pilus assembly protein PilF
MRHRLVAALLLVLLSGAACGQRVDPARLEAARLKRAEELIRAGNESYRSGDYRLAARRYAAAAVVRKNDPAAYFGMGMALSKLGRDEEARVAYAKARELVLKEKREQEARGAAAPVAP